MTYAVAPLTEIGEITDGREPWRPVRHHFGISAFGANAWTGHAAGDRIINEHDEADDLQEELYLVLQGHATFQLGDDRVDAPAGTLVFVRPGLMRTAFAEEADTTILVLGGVPGAAHRPSGWELWAPFRPLYQAGKYAEVADEARAVIEAHSYPEPFYNLACCEALAGRKDDALAHLRRAFELGGDLSEFARNDPDLASLRGDPDFEAILT